MAVLDRLPWPALIIGGLGIFAYRCLDRFLRHRERMAEVQVEREAVARGDSDRMPELVAAVNAGAVPVVHS
ncbi:hypothetical protein [Dactylosporangium fulvum]|uniref:Uncharacterized protein n=1 Tax=Dactylosporangium fulvum TaxID=53359 RepID=A0ABY5VZB0_9ACTN|nr:hypothetical protein [Dactylosporangium fulvum]UWP82201.1 hypothetical protein Dfulv_45265 [Dactylosporangium fulvum]